MHVSAADCHHLLLLLPMNCCMCQSSVYDGGLVDYIIALPSLSICIQELSSIATFVPKKSFFCSFFSVGTEAPRTGHIPLSYDRISLPRIVSTMSRGATLPYSMRQSLLSHKSAGLSHNETDRLSSGGAQGTLVPYLCVVFQVICIVYHVLKNWLSQENRIFC